MRLTPKAGTLKPAELWLSEKSGLLVQARIWEYEDGESQELMARFGGHRSHPSGLVLPYRMEMQVGETRLAVRFVKMEFDIPISEEQVRYPPAVAGLLK